MYLLTKVKPIANMRMKFAYPIEEWGVGVGVETYQEEFLKDYTNYQIFDSLQAVNELVGMMLGDGSGYRIKEVYQQDVKAVGITTQQFINVLSNMMKEQKKPLFLRYVVFGSDDDLHVIAIEKSV